ncbi:hypothetical protein F1640_14775 [Novosphingobium sp. NBM11]|nr:hypothetical protein [Novosphingobium sp. NBM11]
MMALLDNGQDLAACEREIGARVGQLLTPLTRYRNREPSRKFGIDNGGFNELDVPGLFSLLDREKPNREHCLFVAVPDIVFSAQRTLELFHHFAPRMAGWPLALVCQDGQENLPIPWDQIDAVFIGGSDGWKCSRHVEAIMKTAHVLGKHIHAGRVNTPERFHWFEQRGAHSGDGTGMSRYTHMREAIARRGQVATLFDGEAA